MSRCYVCARDYCTCSDDAAEAAYWDHREREEAAAAEAAYLAFCAEQGLVPFSSRDLAPDEARERMEQLEAARHDMTRYGEDR